MGLTQADIPTAGYDRNQWADMLETVRKQADGYLPASGTAAGIQEAADAAEADGAILTLRGEYEPGGIVTVASDLDASAATIVTDSSTETVIRLGTTTSGARVYRKHMTLPRIEQTGKAALGAGVWGSGVAVEASNLYSCQVIVPHVQGFATGVLVTATGTGNVYNRYILGDIENCKVGLELRPGTTGWTNQNTVYDGRYHINSGEGTAISGARHILVSAGTVSHANGNLFVNPSVEGDGPEYHLECYGQYNTWLHARWEATTPTARFNGSNAWKNVVLQGYEADLVTMSNVNGATRNDLYSWDGILLQGTADGRGSWLRRGALKLIETGTTALAVLSNATSSANPVLAVLNSGSDFTTDPAATYRYELSASTSKYKAAADTNPRLQITHATGVLQFGDGTNAPDAGIYRGTGVPAITASDGSIYLRADGGAGTTFYVRESGAWVAK